MNSIKFTLATLLRMLSTYNDGIKVGLRVKYDDVKSETNKIGAVVALQSEDNGYIISIEAAESDETEPISTVGELRKVLSLYDDESDSNDPVTIYTKQGGRQSLEDIHPLFFMYEEGSDVLVVPGHKPSKRATAKDGILLLTNYADVLEFA